VANQPSGLFREENCIHHKTVRVKMLTAFARFVAVQGTRAGRSTFVLRWAPIAAGGKP
jgi:hypothetical protein